MRNRANQPGYAYDRCNKKRPKRKTVIILLTTHRILEVERAKRLYLPPKFFEVLRGELATPQDHDSRKL